MKLKSFQKLAEKRLGKEEVTKIREEAHREYRSYESSLHEALRDRDEALAYLNASLQDEDSRMLIIALKHVLVAQNIETSRLENNPRWDTLKSMLGALGLRIQLNVKKNKFEWISIDKKILKTLSKQATKQGISLEVLINEKLRK